MDAERQPDCGEPDNPGEHVVVVRVASGLAGGRMAVTGGDKGYIAALQAADGRF